jgi:uncharacterized protein (TIGR03000 family)
MAAPALAVGALLLAPGPAPAQHHGGGGHAGGTHMGGAYHGGSWGGYYGHHGYYGYNHYHYGYGYPGFSLFIGLGGLGLHGGGYGYPSYGGSYAGGSPPYYGDSGYPTYPSYAYSAPQHYNTTPSVGAPTQPHAQTYPSTGAVPETGPPPAPGASESAYGPAGGAAQITVRLPPAATLWVDRHQSPLTGPVRQLVTPNALAPGATYRYTLRARWEENGQTVTKEQQVTFKAGDDVKVVFTGGTGS